MKSKPNTPLSRKLGTDVDQSRKQKSISRDYGVFESGYQPWLLRKNGLRISPIPYIKALSAWPSSVGAVIHVVTYCSFSFCFRWYDLVIFFLVTLIIWAFVNVPENFAIFDVFYKNIEPKDIFTPISKIKGNCRNINRKTRYQSVWSEKQTHSSNLFKSYIFAVWKIH